jgi:hypothetical protein
LGHPGVNGFRHKQIHEVDAATLAELREIGRRIGWEAEQERRRNQGDAGRKDTAEAYSFLGKTFQLGNKFRSRRSLTRSTLARPSQLGHGIGDFCEMKGGKCESIQGRTIWKRL